MHKKTFNNAKQVDNKLLTDHRHVAVSAVVVETKDGYKVRYVKRLSEGIFLDLSVPAGYAGAVALCA